MREYYQSIFNRAYEVYSSDNKEETKSILNSLTKSQLIELNETLDIININKSDSKSQIIEDIIFFGIRWEKDRRALQTVNMRG